jgi:hypothetical protein
MLSHRVRTSFWIVLGGFVIMLAGALSGISHQDISYRFQEKQACTFFSSTILAVTAVVSLVAYWIKRRLGAGFVGARFWLLSALGFFYFAMDEAFMMHEGFDNGIARILGVVMDAPLQLDGLTIALFASIALAVSVIHIAQIREHSDTGFYFILGGFCLACAIAFDLAHFYFPESVTIVLEESFEIMSMAFLSTGYFSALRGTIDKIPAV